MSMENRAGSVDGREELQVIADRVRVLTSGSSTGGRYEVFEYNGNPGSTAPHHRHPWDEDYYLLDGEMDLIVNGVARKFAKGESVRVAAGTVHTFIVSATGVRFLMMAAPGGAGLFFRDLDEAMRHGRLDQAEVGRLAALHKVEMSAP